MSSANVQGIRDKRKRHDVLNYLLNDKNKIDILCLQDTHLTHSDEHETLQIYQNTNVSVMEEKQILEELQL